MARAPVQANTDIIISERLKKGKTVYIKITDKSDDSAELALTEMTWSSATNTYDYTHKFSGPGQFMVNILEPTSRVDKLYQYDVVGTSVTAVGAASVYCDATDVSRLMQLNDEDGVRLAFDGSSNPTLAEINKFIEEKSDWIDEVTHHAWRAVTVTNEYYDYDIARSDFTRWDRSIDERCIYLNHRKINTLVSGTHKLELWNGSTWDDLVADFTEGRNSDWWMDYDRGIVYFVGKRPTRTRNAFRTTLKYGETSVPTDIRNMCAKLVAIDLYTTIDFSHFVPVGGDNVNFDSKIDKWEKQTEKVLDQYSEWIVR